MQHFLHKAFEDHPQAAGGLMLDVGSAAVVDKLLTAAKHVRDIWLLEYLPQNRAEVRTARTAAARCPRTLLWGMLRAAWLARPSSHSLCLAPRWPWRVSQMLSWLDADEGCFDWGKCVRYLCDAVASDDPKAVESRVRAAVSYVGPVDLFDSAMNAVQPLQLLDLPADVSTGDDTCDMCGRLVATRATPVREAAPTGSSPAPAAAASAAVSGAGSGCGDGDDRCGSADASTGRPTQRVAVAATMPAGARKAQPTPSGGVWRHGGPRPCRGCGLRPRVSVVSMHSVIECITKDKEQFAFVFDNALQLVTPHRGCVLIMTVNTNTKSWAGGKGRDFAAANISVADVTDHLTTRGFVDVRVTMHHGEAGTEMEETVGVTAVWPGQ